MIERLQAQVQAARADGRALRIRGHGSKDFYGNPSEGDELSTLEYGGIVSHEPSELVVTVRAGTPIAELEAALAEHGQCLAFEPPRFGGRGTVGGMVAAGLAGPSRAAAGSVREHVLGAVLLDGRGEVLHFGGQVIKNVAGYDVSRLLAGSMGFLGVVCEVSLKVLPSAPARRTLRFECDQVEALARLAAWAGRPLPIQASAWWDGILVLRLAGAQPAVDAAALVLGGETIDAPLADGFWNGMRDHADEFFTGAARAVEAGAALWRLALPPTAPPLRLSGELLVEWSGMQRWLVTTTPAAAVRDAAAAAGGHAVLFRALDKSVGTFAPLPVPQQRIHERLKQAFDPDRVFNRGRLYANL